MAGPYNTSCQTHRCTPSDLYEEPDFHNIPLTKAAAKAMLGPSRELQHITNPLFFYCRMRDIGLGKKGALAVCSIYEKEVWRYIRPCISSLTAWLQKKSNGNGGHYHTEDLRSHRADMEITDL